MAIINFLHLEADAITENPVKIPFNWSVRTNMPQEKQIKNEIVISPITVRTWFRIRPLLMEIEADDYNNLLQRQNPLIPDIELVNLITKYEKILLEIIFIGIHNAPGDMDDWYKEALIDNCSWEDIFILANAVLFRIGQQSFRKSITTLRNVSPLTELEIIAAQKNLKSWENPESLIIAQ